MGIKYWTTMLAEEGFIPSRGSVVACCSGSLWRNIHASDLSRIEEVSPGSTLHIDGNGMAFFLHQIAYARQIDEVLQHKRRSEKICAVPTELTTGNLSIHQFLPTFLSLLIIHQVTKEFIEALQSGKVHLIVYWDGENRRVYKQATDAKRAEYRSEESSNLQQYCQYGQLPNSDRVCEWEYKLPKSRLFKTQIVQTLRQLNVDMVECPEEADPYMARVATGDSRSYVLGDDSDFCAFKDIQYIPLKTIHASEKGRLTASVIRRADIAETLGIDESLMVELAILCGNDYIPQPSKAGLSFYSRSFRECVEYLQKVDPGFRVDAADASLREVLAFVRASYELESLESFPLHDDDGSDAEEDLGSLVDNELSVSVDIDGTEEESLKIDSSLLRFRPTVDKSLLDPVIRCLGQSLDSRSDSNADDLLILPMHVEALRLQKDYPMNGLTPSTWRPVWKDVVAMRIVEKFLDAAFDLNHQLPLVRFQAPFMLFDQLRFLHVLVELRVDEPAPGLKQSLEQLSVQELAKPKPPTRDKLPIDEHEVAILEMVSKNRISVIQGETGCGKSSRIPAMLLKRLSNVRLFISQPRRIAAKALVERLRECEPGLRDQIALRMGHGHKEYESKNTRAWFVTTGYLVRLLANYPERFEEITHLIIDEVHERSVDTDILCLLCRRLLKSNTKIRLILMSATLAAALYQDYFDIPIPPIKVGARRFPVEEVFLDDLSSRFALPVAIKKAILSIEQGCQKMKCRVSPNAQVMEKLHQVASHLALVAGSPGSSVLIFVPGMMDIVSITERIEQLYVPGVRYNTFPIHSDIPFEDQMSVFTPAGPDEVKIIIATNAAESSVTLPDVDHVICLGLCKQIVYNELSHRQMLSPTWISKASATQRAGRTGRLRPGTCYRLYTRQNYYEHMIDFEPGEILRIPLDSVILMLKEMLKDEEVTDVLQDCIEPPDMATIERSFRSLYQSQFITSPSGDCGITQLGLFVSALGVDLALGSLVGLGIQFGVAAEVIQMASILSFPKPPWIISNPLVHDNKSFNEMTRRTFISRCHFDANLYSEPLAMMNLLWEFDAIRQDTRKVNEFCQKHGIVVARLRRLWNTCSNLRLRVATYFRMNESDLKCIESPSHMPHAKVTMLRVIQAWVFHDTIIECRPRDDFLKRITPSGYHLKLDQRCAAVTEQHLEQVISKSRHPFVLSCHSVTRQKVAFMYSKNSVESGLFEERFLSYATDKEISIVWLGDKDYLAVYVAPQVFICDKFQALVEKLRERLEESMVYLESNLRRRGVGERPCGRWIICSDQKVGTGKDGVAFHRFETGSAVVARKKIENMRKFHLNNFLQIEPSVKGLSCEFSETVTELTIFNAAEISSSDVKDLLRNPCNIMISKGRQKTGSQTIIFRKSSNLPLSPIKNIKDSSSWERPLLDCLPEGVRLLTVLASSRRKGTHAVYVDVKCNESSDTEETLAIHLDRSDTKLAGRWKRLGTDNDVYTSENSVPATALSTDGAVLYCIASNTLELRGGGMKVEGLTLLPPGPMFLLLTRRSFGLQDLPSLIIDSKKDSDEYRRLRQATEFHDSIMNLGEELRCFPEKTRQLCAIFDGVDGFEGELWDIDSNPFTHGNYQRGLHFSSADHSRDVKKEQSQSEGLKTKEESFKFSANGEISPFLEQSKSGHRKESTVVLPSKASKKSILSKQTCASKQVIKSTEDSKKQRSGSESLQAGKVYQAKSVKAVRIGVHNVPGAVMKQLFDIDLLKSPELPSTAPPASNILAQLVCMYRSAKTGETVGTMRLTDKQDWIVRRINVKDAKLYKATFQSSGIRYPKCNKQYVERVPSWFVAKSSLPRPTCLLDALACLPPAFREPCAISIKSVLIEEQRSLAFDSIELAVRFEACFWLQRQFFMPEMKNWYDQDLPVLINKLMARA